MPTATSRTADSARVASTAPAMHWRVVDEIPNHETNTSILALVDLSSLNELLLDCCWQPPIDHVA